MGGEAIGRRGIEGKGKETAVLLLREDERRPSWSFVSEKNERRGEERAQNGSGCNPLEHFNPTKAALSRNMGAFHP
jgi:hypothetical protein